MNKMFITFAQIGNIPFKNLFKFSPIYKQKFAYLKPEKSEK